MSRSSDDDSSSDDVSHRAFLPESLLPYQDGIAAPGRKKASGAVGGVQFSPASTSSQGSKGRAGVGMAGRAVNGALPSGSLFHTDAKSKWTGPMLLVSHCCSAPCRVLSSPQSAPLPGHGEVCLWRHTIEVYAVCCVCALTLSFARRASNRLVSLALTRLPSLLPTPCSPRVSPQNRLVHRVCSCVQSKHAGVARTAIDMCDPQALSTATRARVPASSAFSSPPVEPPFPLVLLTSPALAQQTLLALRRTCGTHWNRMVRERAKAVAMRLAAATEVGDDASVNGDHVSAGGVGLRSPRSQLLAAAVSSMLNNGTQQCTSDAVGVGGGGGGHATSAGGLSSSKPLSSVSRTVSKLVFTQPAAATLMQRTNF